MYMYMHISLSKTLSLKTAENLVERAQKQPHIPSDKCISLSVSRRQLNFQVALDQRAQAAMRYIYVRT